MRNALNDVLRRPAPGHKGRLMAVRPGPFGGRAAEQAVHRGRQPDHLDDVAEVGARRRGKAGVDGAVGALAALVGGTSARVRRVQNGFVRSYALTMLAGVVVILGAVWVVQ